MDILFTEPIYKDYIWGGYRLKNDLNKNTPYQKTAEGKRDFGGWTEGIRGEGSEADG